MASETVLGLEQADLVVSMEVVGSDQAGDAPTDDGYAHRAEFDVGSAEDCRSGAAPSPYR